jgi:hypothetical protein
VRAGVTSIERASMLDDEAVARMNERRTYLVPTTCPVDRISLDVLPRATLWTSPGPGASAG